ncbi:MAG: NHL repeat-containing protein, partial [Armatimonadota bacterium]
MLVASRGSDRILIFDAEGNFAGLFASGIVVSSPSGLAVGPDGSVYAGVRESSGRWGVVCWDRGGAYRSRLTAAGLGDLSGVAVDASGNVYASSSGEVVRWNPDRSFYGTFSYGSGLAEPAGLALSADGKLFIASAGSGQVLVWNADGTFDRVFRSFGASARPVDVALASDGTVYVLLRLSGGQTGVGVYSPGGSFVRFHSGGAVMPSPTALALRPSDEAVFVSDATTGLLRLGSDGVFRVVVPAGAHGLSQASSVRFRTDLQLSDNSLLVQGLLAVADGNPVPDGVYQLRFRFYAQASGGGVLWSSPALTTQTRSGVFTARLEQIPASVFARGSVWLETVLGSVTLSPRQLLGAQGLAIRSATAAGLRTASGAVATFRVGGRP